MTATGVGIVGAGNISDEYLRSLATYPDVRVVAVADLDAGRAAAQAERYGIDAAPSVADLLARDDVEIVVNLTIPAAHAEVALAAIAAGKHVWGEKPLTLDLASARAVLDAAEAAGVVVANAPDTILGEGIQNAQRLLLDGAIGEPRTLLTLMQGPGPDAWHPRPQFLFARGAGPLFDIGPYYVSTMIQLLGPIASVEAMGQRPRAERVVGSGPDAGLRFPVEVDTHLSVLTRFASGVVGTSVYSFDSPRRRQAFEITGSEGVLEVPVSGFDGPTRLLAGDDRDHTWSEVPPPGAHRERGVGVLELARALRDGRAPRASGRLAFHALEVMLAIEESARSGAPVTVESTAPPVEPLPPGWDPSATTTPTSPAQSGGSR
ncbi:Gfo/Idh/MocA family protein [Leifsonia sp. 21MFCrub1.1]|uniref:Gfo/Idh/MocA family protein n=1 Tax=Leifsonia sp. 21MFCrub1.1 TaxID=1798223 RepID=UPI0008929DFD|nr:Gfo/Idh/MocA family oxidoreductase [Leifsonia sp. 21MFCrub1.1]SEB03582.1 Predicted dehydrogenase [Leifsonia sp. 21MFCrub1.1]